MNEPNNSKFVRRKWNIVNNQSNANYDVGNEIIYNTYVLKFALCDFNDAYILIGGDITIIGHQETQLAFKNSISLTKCITKIYGTTTDDDEDLDLVMSMCKLVKYRSIYSKTIGNLWFYSKDESTTFDADIANINNFKSIKNISYWM